jgi:hypothetical protein
VAVGLQEIFRFWFYPQLLSLRFLRQRVATKKFHWTEGLDAALKRAYQTAHGREELIQNISLMQRLTAFPRFAIISRAAVLGVARMKQRPWTQSDIQHLRELVGTSGRQAIARKLGRTEYSVKAELRKLKLSLEFRDGYTRTGLATVLGASAKTVRRWEHLGWLRTVDGRFSEEAIRRFLIRHPDQYQLSRVDEGWFKGMVFPRFNVAPIAIQERSRIAAPEEVVA